MISLRFVKGNDLFSDAILFDTGGNWSHVEAVTPQGKYLGALANGGVMARSPGYDTGQFSAEKFMRMTASDAMTAGFYGYLNACLGEPYDFGAIAGFVTHLNDHDKHKVICSALQTLALRGSAFFAKALPIPAHQVTPRDLDLMLSIRNDAEEYTP